MSKTTVVNLRREPYDTYIGRAGHGHEGYWGNPFAVTSRTSREDALRLFAEYFLKRLGQNPEFRQRTLALRGKRLGCFCVPQRCHGHVIAEWIDSQPETKNGR